MLITGIEARLVRFELVHAYVTAGYRGKGLSEKNCVIVRVHTDAGLSGVGESDSYPTFTYESPEAVMAILQHRLAPAVIGVDPTNLADLHARMDAAVPGWAFAKAPLDVACYDIWGQSLELPVYKLLGGALRDRVPLIWPIGGGTPQENADEVRTKLDEGYRSFHIKIGAFHPDKDVARVAAIRETVGPDIPLMLDANQGWDHLTALRTIRRLEPYCPSMVEQPIPAWDRTRMAQLQSSVSLPLSADESLHSLHDAADLVRSDAVRVFSLKTGKVGGLFRARQLAAIAEAAGYQCFVNSMIEMGISVAASLHLAATLPNLVDHGQALMSNLRIKQDILHDDSFRYEGRDILVPQDRAGLGVNIDDAELEHRTVSRFVVGEGT